MNGLFHTIISGANVGVLSLAAAAYALRFLLKDGESSLARSADTVAFGSAIFGLVLSIVTALTGYFGTWNIAAVQNSMLLQNKILMSFVLFGSWGMFIYLRWKVGADMWNSMTLKIWSAILVLTGFVSSGLLGSLGGSAALKGTAIQGIFSAFSINRYDPWNWSVWLSLLVIIAALGLAFYSNSQKAK